MDQLPSWRPGAARSAIESFVGRVTGGESEIPPEARVAVFDNDGTLWTEKPMPTQLHFLVQQWAAVTDPALVDTQPYAAARSGNLAWLGDAIDKHYVGDDSDLGSLIAAIARSTAGLNVEDYEADVARFYRESQHLTLHKPYSGVVYQPMIELLRYLEANGFTCYIVTGGERDFVRSIASEYYGIPPERVVGSAFGLEYEAGEVRYGAALSFFDDGPEKPSRIWSRIGRRPILAAGNSNGDAQMLEYARGSGASLSLVIHHDDDTGRGDTPYDKGAEKILESATGAGITVVSVRDDWATVFPG